MGKLFEPVIENKLDTISKNYRNDLYNSRGLFNLIMVDQFGVGQNRRELTAFFGGATERVETRNLADSQIKSSSYSPFKTNNNVTAAFMIGGKGVEYNNTKDQIEIFNPFNVLSKTIDAKTEKFEGEFETGANKIQHLLEKNQDILRDSLNKKVSRNFISNGIMTNLVDSYYENIKSRLLSSKRTYDTWDSIYESVQENEEYVSRILGENKVIEDTKMLYGRLEGFEDDYKYAPFNAIKSKEEAALSYACFQMLVHTVSSEVLLKSLPVFEAFGADLFNDYDILGEYIYSKFNQAIDDFSNDRRRIKVLEKLAPRS